MYSPRYLLHKLHCSYGTSFITPYWHICDMSQLEYNYYRYVCIVERERDGGREGERKREGGRERGGGEKSL